MEEYVIQKKSGLESYSTDQLVAVICKWRKGLPPWMMAMRQSIVDPPVGVSVSEAWQDLILREKKLKEVVSVKGAVDAITTDKVLTYSPEASVVRGADGKSEEVINHAGHLIRKVKVEDPSFVTLIAVENFIDATMFPIQKRSAEKKVYELIDRSQVGALQFPEFPISDYMVHFKMDDPVDLRRKFMVDASKHGAGKFIDTLKDRFPPTMQYVGMGAFTVPKPVTYISDGSITQMYRQINASRKLRGNDNDHSSLLTTGYYYGYMSMPMYRTFHTVSDVLRVLRTSGIKVLRIGRQAGIFNSTVIWSLIANGVYIHSDADSHLAVCDLTGEHKGKPGIYSKVLTDGNVLRYFELNDRYPEYKSGVFYSHPVMDRLLELSSNTNIKHFSILYLREELIEHAQHLMPSAHAHSGHVIWFQDELKEKLDIGDYCKRVVAATSYKCYAAYCRTPFILRDKYAYKQSFSITQKALKNFSEFETVDYSLADAFVTDFQYDTQLGELSESVRETYLTMASQDKPKIEKLMSDKKIVYVTEDPPPEKVVDLVDLVGMDNIDF